MIDKNIKTHVDLIQLNSLIRLSKFKPVKIHDEQIKRINVTFNNLKGEHNWGYLWEKRKEVIDKVESYFNLDWRKYGSKWDFDFYEAKKEPLRF